MGWLEDILGQKEETEAPFSPMMDMSQLPPQDMPLGNQTDNIVSPMDLLPKNDQLPSKKAVGLPPVQQMAPTPQLDRKPAASDMNPVVKDYLQKLNPSKYTDEARQALLDKQAEDNTGFDIQAGLGGLAGALASYGTGKMGGIEGAERIKKMKRGMQDQELSNFDSGLALEKLKMEKDPNSMESKYAQELALKMGMKPEMVQGLTAAKFKELSPVTMKMYEIDERVKERARDNQLRREDMSLKREANDIAKEERNSIQREKMDEKRTTKEDALRTPYGFANTPDDAKQIKEGYEAKANFDSKLQEMIDLRKNKGSEFMDREAVARGKQLSKDLLLEYKNMAKLGVLSQADQGIIDAIIPQDPLAMDWAPGQDPILSNMEKFKADSDKDFQNRIDTRIKTRSGRAAPGSDDEAAAARQKRIAELRAKKGMR